MTTWCILAILTTAALPEAPLAAQEQDTLDNLPNIEGPTLGGMQFWADVWLLHQYRIQRNVLTGHFRLLDPDDRRLAAGSLAHCRAELDRVARERGLAPMRGDLVLVLHGLFRTRGSMARLCEYLRQHTSMEVIALGYPSTRETVAQDAEALAQAMESLRGVQRVHFVAHSLGNLVIRHYLGDLAAAPPEVAPPPVGRFVMLAPPNHQPVLATKLAPLDFTRQIGGPALRELSTGWSELEPHLATPPGEFGIIAGGPGGVPLRNPLVPGESDLVITIESTRLVGARDFRVVPTEHTFLMNEAQVQELTAQFLLHVYF